MTIAGVNTTSVLIGYVFLAVGLALFWLWDIYTRRRR